MKNYTNGRRNNNQAEAYLETLYREYGRLMLYVAEIVLGNRADAEDAVQESLLKIWGMLDTISGLENPKAYILKITKNTALDVQRSNLSRTKIIDTNATEDEINQIQDSASQTIDSLIDSEEYNNLIELVESLSDALKETATYYFVMGLTYEEISKLTGVTVEVLRLRISRSRKILQKKILNQKDKEGDSNA